MPMRLYTVLASWHLTGLNVSLGHSPLLQPRVGAALPVVALGRLNCSSQSGTSTSTTATRPGHTLQSPAPVPHDHQILARRNVPGHPCSQFARRRIVSRGSGSETNCSSQSPGTAAAGRHSCSAHAVARHSTSDNVASAVVSGHRLRVHKAMAPQHGSPRLAASPAHFPQQGCPGTQGHRLKTTMRPAVAHSSGITRAPSPHLGRDSFQIRSTEQPEPGPYRRVFASCAVTHLARRRIR